jgi:hypothetical protein
MSEPAAVPLDPAEERKLRRLKAVVIILGVLIVLGLIALVFGIIWRSSGKTAAPPAGTTPAPVLTSGSGVAARLSLPEGTNVVDMDLDGNRILLRTRSISGDEEFIIYDAAKNQIIARVALEREP